MLIINYTNPCLVDLTFYWGKRQQTNIKNITINVKSYFKAGKMILRKIKSGQR